MVEYTAEFLRKSAARANRNMISYFKREIPMLLRNHHNALPELSQIFQMTSDANAYINGGFIERIKGLYTPEERQFILDKSDQFERVKLGFAYFSLLSSNQRPFEAIRLTHAQLRTGWQKTGVPLGFNQTLDDHLGSISRLAFLLFFDDPEISLITRTAQYHDAGEPVIGDFTPVCPISRSDKGQIEMLGVRLITSARTREHPLAEWIYDAVTLYDGTDPQHENIRSKVRDCDLLEMCVEAVFLMANCPEKQRNKLNTRLQEFWDYVGAKLTNDRAKNFFESLSTARCRTDIQQKDFTEIISHAHTYMLISDPDGAVAHKRFREAVMKDQAAKEAPRITPQLP